MRETLKSFQFIHDWIDWVMNMTLTTFFSIFLNGCPTKTLIQSIDIRQGDHLSPFLFIIMA